MAGLVRPPPLAHTGRAATERPPASVHLLPSPCGLYGLQGDVAKHACHAPPVVFFGGAASLSLSSGPVRLSTWLLDAVPRSETTRAAGGIG